MWRIYSNPDPHGEFYIFDFFSRTTRPILIRLGTNHPWGRANEGDISF
jgi:hypothetical protein